MSSINFSGIASGIDTNAIVSEMISIDRQPEEIMKANQTNFQNQQTAYKTLSASLLAMQSAAYSLNGLRSFNLVTASTTDATVASVTAQTGAQIGTHSITVTTLAQAEKISTGVQNSQTAPLNFTGQIIVNGEAINVQASDSLQTLSQNINAAQTGVTASIISPTSGQYYLTFASDKTGIANKISISDTGGGTFVSNTLGLFDATPASVSHTITSGGNTLAGSNLFADSATSIGTLEGQSSPASGNVQITIGGVTKSVAIDLSTDSLSAVASKINAQFGSTVATIAATTDPNTGDAKQQLQINGGAAAPTFVDNNNVLANMGVVQRNYAANIELSQAKDAVFTLDNLPGTRSSNTISDAITGVTINLLKDGGATTNVTVSSDTSTIKTNINAFVTAYNAVIDKVAGYSSYDSGTGDTGILFGDSTTDNMLNNLVLGVTAQIPGLPSSMSMVAQAGITLDSSDHLVVDDTALSSALSSNLAAVGKLFQAVGTPTDPTVQFVTGTSDTKASGSAGYSIDVTSPATQATVTAGAALGANTLAQDEVLTFGGSLFGTTVDASTTALTGGYSITLHAGSSLTDVISQINGDAKISPLLSATNVGGKLTLTAKQYGSGVNFAVTSAIAGSTTSSGIGTAISHVNGTDIVGTINGESAIGSGQFLTGNLTGGSANGLQLRITAASAGHYGNVTYTSGIASFDVNYVTLMTDASNGLLTSASTSLQDQIDGITSDISDLEARLSDEQQTLTQRFTDMETSVANIKAAAAGLSSLTGTTSSSSSSTGTSSSG